MPALDDERLSRDRLIAAAREHFDRAETEAAIAVLRGLEGATIDEETIKATDALLASIARGEAIVASFDPARRPGAGERVLIYGNYPHIFENLVVNNPAKRHVASFWDVVHDRVESDPRWDAIGRIYVINAASRPDRLDAVLRELASARAPFDRIERLVAAMPATAEKRTPLAGSIGCLESHIAALRRASEGGFAHTLVLEDDFSFTSDLADHLNDLGVFFARGYDYWICLLATSKYGRVLPKDDLVSLTFQPCTNAGAYLVSRDGIARLLPLLEEALAQLKETGDPHRYAIDRCWTILQSSNKFLVFRKKFGFQAASYSDIEGVVARYLD